MRLLLMSIVLSGAVVSMSWAQGTSTAASAQTATCNFQDGKEISVRYSNQAPGGKGEVPAGRVWTPGGQPMLLFTQTPLSADNLEIPTGAYSMYIVRSGDKWTLIVNKNVSAGSKYDEHQDLLRVAMQTGQLSEPQQFSLAFAHIEPKQCNLRIYYGKSGTWAEFRER